MVIQGFASIRRSESGTSGPSITALLHRMSKLISFLKRMARVNMMALTDDEIEFRMMDRSGRFSSCVACLCRKVLSNFWSVKRAEWTGRRISVVRSGKGIGSKPLLEKTTMTFRTGPSPRYRLCSGVEDEGHQKTSKGTRHAAQDEHDLPRALAFSSLCSDC
ncbi:hypothetical protein BKA81DRAFT_142960 [Phyllosticta paracitricarpa]